jgi:hypothetical protein
VENIAICCIIKDENEYLMEWIKYHELIGIHNFILYDNDSKVPISKTIKDDVSNIIPSVVHVIPIEGCQVQLGAYRNCLKLFKDAFKWIAFIDTDEFIVPLKCDDINDVLNEFDSEKTGGLCVNWLTFGPSGHITKQDGKLISNFIKCAPKDHKINTHVKSIVRPDRTESPITPHSFRYKGGYRGVSEDHRWIIDSFSKNSTEKIQINHYYTRSKEEFEKKIIRGRGDTNQKRSIEEFYYYDKICTETNTSVLRFANKF